jgi:hypothetical protein
MPRGGIRPSCSVANCGKPHKSGGFCQSHYRRWKSYGDPLLSGRRVRGVCSIANCGEPAQGRGLCKRHHEIWRRSQTPLCSVDGCADHSQARGLCPKHLARWYTKGDPSLGRVHKRSGLRFIHEHAVAYLGGDCLLWPYGKTEGGYGAVRIDRRQCGVHVVVCELVHGPKPDPSFEVAHGCGNRACCNPKHLRWATRSDNHADKVQHGTALRGEKHHKARLTETDVREIRALHGKLSQAEIARRYGLKPTVIGGILRRRSWKWLE